MTARLGLAGRLAATFIPSKLTPLLIIGAMALGAFAIAERVERAAAKVAYGSANRAQAWAASAEAVDL